MPRLRLQVQGVVQGVGFRPFVFRLARELGLDGWVQNRPEGVLIEVQGAGGALAAFPRRLQAERPRAAVLQRVRADPMPEALRGEPFRILPSEREGRRRASIPADLALCPDCAAEIRDPAARRFRYPFTNCTACGPRYSIVAALPYDRPRTAMASFPLCADCRKEFEDPGDRRFHAQPVACPRCGPRLAFQGSADGPGTEGGAALAAALDLLRRGGILALKGLGGFQLLADARSQAAVQRLRDRKGRAEKPFAVMFPDPEALRAACAVGPAGLAVLTGPEAPILLLPRREGCGLAPAVAPDNPDLGAFLPYTPLHRLLLDDFGGPLVCTSGNRSEEPMATGNAEARLRLGDIADGFLDHDRPVLRPLDDSVGRMEAGTLHLLRRARGFAPLPLPMEGAPVLALGGQQKATVTLLAQGQAVVSQHLGDLGSARGLALLERTAEDLLDFLKAKPGRLACDLHPDYASTRVAEALARRLGLPLLKVQHHHAHVAAAMAEHGLRGPLLGLAWDGSGFGPDGTVWGGEALEVDEAGFRRVGHLRPFPLPGGERAVREPRRSALGLCLECLGEPGPAAAAFTRAELEILGRAAGRGVNAPRCSSVGRLFDAVASLIGIRAGAGFEGQAAMALEFQARQGRASGAYRIPLAAGQADPAPLLEALVRDLRRKAPVPAMAFRFHAALAGLALAFAEAAGLEQVVLTGGCFQNSLLAELCRERLASRGFRVVRPAMFPANDGGLSLGQAWVAARAPMER
jgi:hydrogenase maturation protein HypF